MQAVGFCFRGDFPGDGRRPVPTDGNESISVRWKTGVIVSDGLSLNAIPQELVVDNLDRDPIRTEDIDTGVRNDYQNA